MQFSVVSRCLSATAHASDFQHQQNVNCTKVKTELESSEPHAISTIFATVKMKAFLIRFESTVCLLSLHSLHRLLFTICTMCLME